MMRPRRFWPIMAISLALLLILLTFPMRLALGLAGAADAGVAAREVRGSIWSGELADARLGAIPLGTVEAHLSPLALLTGQIELAFSRSDERIGALAGRLHASNPRGISHVDGVATLAGGLGVIPVDTLRFEDATLRFDRDGRCAEANGRMQVMVTAPIAGLDLSRGLSGSLNCVGGRAQAGLASQSGTERLTFLFDGRGAYRANFAIRVDDDPAMAAALSTLGFRSGPGGFLLTTTGHF